MRVFLDPVACPSAFSSKQNELALHVHEDVKSVFELKRLASISCGRYFFLFELVQAVVAAGRVKSDNGPDQLPTKSSANSIPRIRVSCLRGSEDMLRPLLLQTLVFFVGMQLLIFKSLFNFLRCPMPFN